MRWEASSVRERLELSFSDKNPLAEETLKIDFHAVSNSTNELVRLANHIFIASLFDSN